MARKAPALTEYKRKRRFANTPEPAGAPSRRDAAPGALSFVIQKHAASRLHFDFRLELDGTLKSWAVPKGPSLNPDEKRLAVQVEDHPLEYATFEGNIPKGEYGGGSVIVWDRGTWSPRDGDPEGSLRKGKLSFTLNGERLRGAWVLFRLSGQEGERQPNWMLKKSDDEFADADGERLVRDELTSVDTGRSLEDVAADQPQRPTKKTGRVASKRKAKRASSGVEVAHLEQARRMAMPEMYAPQLATLVEKVPTGPGWIHEVKFDGYRLIAQRVDGEVRLITRGKLDWAAHFPKVRDDLAAFTGGDLAIDGEACALDREGKPSFQLMQQTMKGHRHPVVFFAFDLLYLDGYDLTQAPLEERKRLLAELLGHNRAKYIRLSEDMPGEPSQMHEAACRLKLEGIISKRASAPYTQGRTRDWLKIKCGQRQEFVVIGWSAPAGSRTGFGSLALGAYRDDKLIYTGRVGTGFDQKTLAHISRRLRGLEAKSSEAAPGMSSDERRGITWVRPTLVAEVSFAEWTDDGRLRHPSFEGLREDKDPRSVVIERPQEEAPELPPVVPPKKRAGSRPAEDGSERVAGVRISHPERVVYPDVDITKLQVAQYYEAVAPFILPYVANRPLSTVRCPGGTTKPCFFQKHIGAGFGTAIKPVRVREDKGEGEYISIADIQGLLTLIQFGVLELHAWASRVDTLEQPDFFVIDLDPGEGVTFAQVVRASLDVKALLERIDLESYVKVTGGKGVHVVVPLQRGAEWSQVRDFSHAIAMHLSVSEPKRFLAVMTKAKRTGRIFVDYLRNGRGATAISPYSTRNRPGATVAMPVSWAALSKLKSATDFTVLNAAAHLRRRRTDPWKDFFRTRQQLTPARAKALMREASAA